MPRQLQPLQLEVSDTGDTSSMATPPPRPLQESCSAPTTADAVAAKHWVAMLRQARRAEALVLVRGSGASLKSLTVTKFCGVALAGRRRGLPLAGCAFVIFKQRPDVSETLLDRRP